jgi:hypothetical protein
MRQAFAVLGSGVAMAMASRDRRSASRSACQVSSACAGIISSIAFNPDRSGVVAAGSYAGVAGLYDEATMQLQLLLYGHKGGITQASCQGGSPCMSRSRRLIMHALALQRRMRRVLAAGPGRCEGFDAVRGSRCTQGGCTAAKGCCDMCRCSSPGTAIICTLALGGTATSCAGTSDTPLRPCTACAATPAAPTSECSLTLSRPAGIWRQARGGPHLWTEQGAAARLSEFGFAQHELCSKCRQRRNRGPTDLVHKAVCLACAMLCEAIMAHGTSDPAKRGGGKRQGQG